jgi:hypothetical protein
MQLDYEWVDGWGHLPPTGEAAVASPHAGIVVTPSNEIVTVLPWGGGLLVLGPDGDVRRTAATEVAEAHGITLVEPQVTRRYAVQTPNALGERAAEALARAGLTGR